MPDTIALADGIADWFADQARELPWRGPSVSAWRVLVSEVMLQQTPVARVLPIFLDWMARWPDPAAFAAASRADVLRAWGRLGYPRRALRLHDAATTIVHEHAGIVPRELDALLALPGVGAYTARAVATFAYGDRHPVVDTNVRRVLARAVCGDAEPWPPSARRDLAEMERLLPRDPVHARVVSAGTMELGALVCTARSPRCPVCPIRSGCEWVARGRPAHDGPRRSVQAAFEGSDRQVRGVVLSALRAKDGPVSADELRALWPDGAQLERALEGLHADGLLQRVGDGGAELPT